jgi:hypothetical protein
MTSISIKGISKQRFFYISYTAYVKNAPVRACLLTQATTHSWNMFKKPEINYKQLSLDIKNIHKESGNIFIDNIIELSHQQYLDFSK